MALPKRTLMQAFPGPGSSIQIIRRRVRMGARASFGFRVRRRRKSASEWGHAGSLRMKAYCRDRVTGDESPLFAASVDFTNFLCAARFSPLPGDRSTASADILAATRTDAAQATHGSPKERPPVGRLADLVAWRRSRGPTLPYDTSPTERALSKARLRVPSDS
jgi:hypothetical protein